MAVINKTVAEKINNIINPVFGLEQVEENPTFNKYRLQEINVTPLSSCKFIYEFAIEILLSSLTDSDYLVFGYDSLYSLLLQNGYSVEWKREDMDEEIEGRTGYIIKFNCKTFI